VTGDDDRPVFGPDDDRFHFDVLGDDWWATETAWFSFHHPDRRLGGWLYTMVRPNIGTVAGGVWVWDESAHLPWEVPYSTNYSALRLPPDTDLRDAVLPTGVAIRVLEPGHAYELRYEDDERLQLALRYDGVMRPEPLAAVGSTFGSAHHFDQFGRVTGHVVLHGERMDVDCVAMRDRTWGRRPEDRPRRAAYVTGAAPTGDCFLAVTNIRGDVDTVAYGFLRRDERTVTLAAGDRRVERSTEHGWITAIEIQATDAHGRPLYAVGEPVSRIIVNRHTFIDVNSLVRWDIDGVEAWGEDQDMWPVHAWRRHRRERREVTA
jgi:hypothetical protein